VDIAFENIGPGALTVTIEPWAEEHVLLVGERLRLSFHGTPEGMPLIEHLPTGFIIYGWPGSTVSVSRNGGPVHSAGHIPAPNRPM
jgi:hypothetical protein